MEGPCFTTLASHSVRLLLELARQYNGFNNGDLCAAWRLMHPRGWRSREALHRALKELKEHGLILLTRQGGKHRANLYALTWEAIDECGGKLDVAATRTPPGDWRTWNEQFLNPAGRVNVTQQWVNSEPKPTSEALN